MQYLFNEPLVSYNLQHFSDLDASLIHDMGKRIFGDLFPFLPLEGNLIVAKNQHVLYTFYEWREIQHGVGHLAYHVQLFSPPSLQEPKVEEIFHELPFWEVTHFVWVIAWENMISKSI